MAGAAVAYDVTERRPAAGAARGYTAFAAVTVLVLLLGWVEGWYGPTVAGDVYGSDAVQYLDIARAFERGDLHSALNPLWSQGYPALLALIRGIFAPGVEGEWHAIRWLNFGIYALSWLGFAAFVRELLRGRERRGVTWFGAVCVFLTTQLCMDQVSRVGPDQLVAAVFFAVCTLLLRMRRRPSKGLSLELSGALGLLLGVGFFVKSIFLPLGFVAIALAAAGFVLERRGLWRAVPAAAVFGVVVLGYGAALSHEVGSRTLGEAGSLNYAWHVNRLAKWVHWEGGVDAAEKAWPKAWIARFTRWEGAPPDFGKPLHASVVIGSSPAVYSFHAPVQATYVPYFDAPYFYAGYRHVLRWRYQVVALGKNAVDLAQVVLQQPLFWVLGVCGLAMLRVRGARTRFAGGMRAAWPVWALALSGVAIYLPVHLEGRYLAPFLAILALGLLDGSAGVLNGSAAKRWLMPGLLATGFAAGFIKVQHEGWSRALHHRDYRDNLEWREGAALRASLEAAGIAPGAELGVISWGPNLQCDWAYLAGVRITSEIQSAADERAFWGLPANERGVVMLNFRQAGAEAVITRDAPGPDAAGWQQVSGVPLWIYRF